MMRDDAVGGGGGRCWGGGRGGPLPISRQVGNHLMTTEMWFLGRIYKTMLRNNARGSPSKETEERTAVQL